MEIALLAALVSSYVAFLVFLHFFIKQVKEERAELLTRIQAPDLAPLTIVDENGEVLNVEYDDDEDFEREIKEMRKAARATAE